MIRILTTPGPEGLTEIQWIERYHYEQAMDLLRRLETLLRVCPVMHRIGKDGQGKAFVLETINAQLDVMELERIRAMLRKDEILVPVGFGEDTRGNVPPELEPDHK